MPSESPAGAAGGRHPYQFDLPPPTNAPCRKARLQLTRSPKYREASVRFRYNLGLHSGWRQPPVDEDKVMKEYLPLAVALAALVTGCVNSWFMFVNSREKAASDRRLAKLTAELGANSQTRSAAEASARALLEGDLVAIGTALQTLQAVKDRLQELRVAIGNPNAALRAPLEEGFSVAVGAYKTALGALREHVANPEWDKPHQAKNDLNHVQAAVKGGLRGAKYIEGCKPGLAEMIDKTIEDIRDVQNSLRDSILRRHSLLNVGLA